MAQISRTGAVVGFLTAVGAFAVVIGGCGGGSGSGFAGSTGLNNNPLVGTWTREAIAVDGESVTCPNNLIINGLTVDTCSANETLQFTSTGTYTISYPKQRFGHLYAEYGTYSRSGSTLTLTRTATATDTQDSGSLDATDTTTLATPQVIPNAIAISSDNKSFTLTPAAPTTTSGYTVPVALDGSVVSSTFTLGSTSTATTTGTSTTGS